MDDAPSADLSALEQLPAELLIKVLRLSPDLTALHSLLLASPAITRVFSQAARDITDAVVSASLPLPTQAAVGAVMRIRASAHDCRSAADVSILAQEKDPRPLPSAAATPALLRRFVALAHEIHVLAHACLENYIDRCLALRPARLRDPNFRYPGTGTAWLARPEGEPYEVPAQEPPSWIEEQRVLRDMWLAQVFYETQLARLKGRLGWTEGEMRVLEGLSAVDFYHLSGYRREQMLTVVDFLDRRSCERRARSPPAFRMPQPRAKEGNFHLVCSPEPVFASSKEDKWGQGPAHLDRAPMAWVFQRRLAADWRSPLRCITFEPYRAYGFAIWDHKRLVSLGFFSEDKARALMEPCGLYFTWRSILTDEEIEAARGAYEAARPAPG
ncbi:hypothetical protein VTK56DRAFT_8446 [Thermocarpiscus australiensis]